MRTHRILLVAAVLFVIPALSSAASPPVRSQTPEVTSVRAPAVPSLDAFLGSLEGSAPSPVNLAGCGPDFCTQAQRNACTQQCLQHHGGSFVGLQCCSSSCTTICNCGSVPIEC